MEYQERLKILTGNFIVPIQESGKVDVSLGRDIIAMSKELAKSLKSCELVPKALLKEIYFTAKILRAELPYIKSNASEVEEVANELSYSFDLILLGEAHQDRMPGVPRII